MQSTCEPFSKGFQVQRCPVDTARVMSPLFVSAHRACIASDACDCATCSTAAMVFGVCVWCSASLATHTCTRTRCVSPLLYPLPGICTSSPAMPLTEDASRMPAPWEQDASEASLTRLFPGVFLACMCAPLGPQKCLPDSLRSIARRQEKYQRVFDAGVSSALPCVPFAAPICCALALFLLLNCLRPAFFWHSNDALLARDPTR